MGGSESSEFVAKTDAGEDLIASCANCGYAANVEKATSRLPVLEDEAGPEKPEQFPTPGVRTSRGMAYNCSLTSHRRTEMGTTSW